MRPRRLPNRVKHNDFGTFSRKMGSRIGPAPRRCPRPPKGNIFSENGIQNHPPHQKTHLFPAGCAFFPEKKSAAGNGTTTPLGLGSELLCLQTRHLLCLQTRHLLCQQTRHLLCHCVSRHLPRHPPGILHTGAAASRPPLCGQ